MVEIIISSSVLVLVLAILRLLLRDKISARLQYALWLLVLVRLLVPVSFFQSPVSVAEAAKPVTEQAERISQTDVSTGPISQLTANRFMRFGVFPDESEPTYNMETPMIWRWSLKTVALTIWRAGIVVMAAWFLFVNLRMAWRLKKNRTPYDNAAKPPVYVAGRIPSPCLFFDLFAPVIYLTEQAAEDEARARQIIAHERTHLRHGDLIWAFLRSVCLTVWWFNPFVWLAAALSRQDCELACDEGTIKALGEDARFDYGRTLVGMAKVGARPSDLLCGATTMTSGKKSLKARVARIADAPKISVIAVILALCVAAAAVGCTFSGAAEKTAEAQDMPVPMIVVNGRLYCSTGEQLPGEPDPSAYAGSIESVVPLSEQPTEEDQANFGEVGDPYIMELSGPVVLMDNEWTRFISADEANYLDLAPAPEVIADGVVSAIVWGEGRTAELTEAEELKRLLTVMESVEFQQTFDLKSAYAPGAESVGVTLRYEEGSEVQWTYPYMRYNGAIFESETRSAGLFGSFLYPELYAGAGSVILTDPETGDILAITASPEMAAEAEPIGSYDREYWEEVDRELASFAYPADIEMAVADGFDETLPEDDIFGPLTIADYIYGTDSWQFLYNGELAGGVPLAHIAVYDADGRVLWIIDDTDALMITEADGSITCVTLPDGVDCADMIRHLLPWARGEFARDDTYAPEPGDSVAAAVPAPALPELPEGFVNDYVLEGDEKEQALAMLMSFASPVEVSVNSVGDVAPAESPAADFAAFVSARDWEVRYSPGPAANAPDASIILTNGAGTQLWIVSDLDYLALVLPEETFENNHPELHFYDGAADGEYLRELWSWAAAHRTN